MATQVLLDVDTGIDDALALLYAVAHPDLELLGVSCVAGNSPLEQVVANTLKVLDVADATAVEVAAGAAAPLVECARRKDQPHGPDGLGGIALPSSSRTPGRSATELFRHTLTTAAEPITLVALAPMTNLALLLATHPEVADRLARIVFVGGWVKADPGLEFNVWQDPEAAATVIAAGVPLTMYSMDVLRRVSVEQAAAERLSVHEHPVVRLAGDLLLRRRSGSGHYTGLIGDAGVLVMLTNPELFEVNPRPVTVGLTGPNRGRAIIGSPRNHPASDTPVAEVDVVTGVDPTAADVFTATIEHSRGQNAQARALN